MSSVKFKDHSQPVIDTDTSKRVDVTNLVSRLNQEKKKKEIAI